MTEPLTPEVPSTARPIEGFGTLGFFPADHAAAENGKVYANGAYWTVLRFPAFPATLPTCAVVTVLKVPFHQSQADHDFVIGLEDHQQRRLPQLRVEGSFRTSPGLLAEFGEGGVLPIAVQVHGLTFDSPGHYSFVIEVDGNLLDRYRFRVIHVAMPGLGPASISPNV